MYWPGLLVAISINFLAATAIIIVRLAAAAEIISLVGAVLSVGALYWGS